MDTFNSHMWQTKSLTFIMDASIARHMLLSNILSLHGQAPVRISDVTKKVNCFLINEGYVCIHINQRLNLLIKSILESIIIMNLKMGRSRTHVFRVTSHTPYRCTTRTLTRYQKIKQYLLKCRLDKKASCVQVVAWGHYICTMLIMDFQLIERLGEKSKL